jgi:2-dehydro-3-deoxyphosphogluconate aldolase/(4S)-4-hydroxy-2-oxoglutarate aldolase
MQSINTVSAHILSATIIPLFYEAQEQVAEEVVKALYNGGVRTIEFTNRGANALPVFKKLQTLKSTLPGLLLGIGTIKTAEDAKNYIDAGADFLISPVFDASVADIAYLNKILWIPGCMTPTEIHVAQSAGCNIIKLFPGNVLGAGFIEAIQPLFSGIHFLVTGGVEATSDNIAMWLKAGAAGVGLGSKLITKQVLAEKNYLQLTKTTQQLLAIHPEK